VTVIKAQILEHRELCGDEAPEGPVGWASIEVEEGAA